MESFLRCLVLTALFLFAGCVAENEKLATHDDSLETTTQVKSVKTVETVKTTGELKPPKRLEAEGKPIDIGLLSGIAHAGPWVADVDCDGDEDLLVGDFPGFFWFFENENSDDEPKYLAGVKLQAGDDAAKTPVY